MDCAAAWFSLVSWSDEVWSWHNWDQLLFPRWFWPFVCCVIWFSDTRAPHGLLPNTLSIFLGLQAKWCTRRPSSTNMQGLILQNFHERLPQLRFQCLGISTSLHTLMYTWSPSYTNIWNNFPHSKHDSLRLHPHAWQQLLQCEDVCGGGLPVYHIAISIVVSRLQLIFILWHDRYDVGLLLLSKIYDQFVSLLSCNKGHWCLCVAPSSISQ